MGEHGRVPIRHAAMSRRRARRHGPAPHWSSGCWTGRRSLREHSGGSMMIVRRWLLVAPLVLLLAVSAAPAAYGQSTPTGEAAAGTCIPEGGIPQKDSYLIGMSQANNGDPTRHVTYEE